jgi:hypothetical protein
MANQSAPYRGANHSPNPRFTDDLLRIIGADFDPDPLFLEECWTLGVPTAAENLHRRQQELADRESRRRAAENAIRSNDAWQQDWSPADWAPSDRAAQSRIPHGWMPENVPKNTLW